MTAASSQFDRQSSPITIVGAGISGAACAYVLAQAGIAFRIVERGRAPGGRLASPMLHNRRVDIGAAYFTVRDEGFGSVVKRWADAGLARVWTDTFSVLAPGTPPTTKVGPERWSTAGGLRTLARDLLTGIEVQTDGALSELPTGDVVLAMPDPQAARLAAVPNPVEYQPTIVLICGFAQRQWDFRAAFVEGHPDFEFIADDGSRRGDDAPVLVVHSTADFARSHLDAPQTALEPLVAGLRKLLSLDAPIWTHIHRWTFAKPSAAHQRSYGLIESDDRWIGFAGDQWCPLGSPRVESAWRSGTDLGYAIIDRRNS